MAEAVSDRQLVVVLRPFVRACGPVLDAVRDSDPLRLKARARDAGTGGGVGRRIAATLTSLRMPGTAAWDAMGPDRRVNWWVNRFGRLAASVAAIPGLGGALADRLPVRDMIGLTAQGLVLCAIAREFGVTDTDARVRLLAAVLFKRDIDPALATGRTTAPDRAEEDAEVDHLIETLGRPRRGRAMLSPRAVGGTLWRLARSLWGLADELGKRPRGRWYHRLLGTLPLVGAFGDYLGERAGLRTARTRAIAWLHTQTAPMQPSGRVGLSRRARD